MGSRACARLAPGLLVAALASLVPAAASAEEPRTLHVFAAASLADAFRDVARTFEHEHPGTRVQLQLASSQLLARQLEQGARADVFASADPAWLSRLEQAGQLDGPWELFARNPLVVIARPRTDGDPGLHFLASPATRLALASPAVPAGRASRLLLRSLGRLPGFGKAFADSALANRVPCDDVAGVLRHLERGEVDAGIVYATDWVGHERRSGVALPVPEPARVSADYAVGVLHGPALSQARAFVAALHSHGGRRALARHGFAPVTPP